MSTEDNLPRRDFLRGGLAVGGFAATAGMPFWSKLALAQDEVLVPFSGGRDSSYGLHLIIHELGLRPVTYTYDWGMVTDLGRRNVSRMSAKLGVENIIVAADITKKRDYIRRNLEAWIKHPLQ